MGHETRVRPNRVESLPHTMLQRGYACNHQKLRGGTEQTYSVTIARALQVCGAHKSEWVQLAKDTKKWKLFVEGEAKENFMTWWYEREKDAKDNRRRRRRRVEGLPETNDSDSGEDDTDDDDAEKALEDDHSEGQLMKDGENNYGEEELTEANGSDWSEQSENLGMSCSVATESEEQIPQGTETEVPNEIIEYQNFS